VKLQDWKNAFVYTKSIDIRLKEDGKRVFELGLLCKSNNELTIALKCFEYCTKLGINGHDPNLSQSNYLEVKYLLLQQKNGSNIEWNTLIAELKAFENENGPSIETLPIAETLSQIYIERRNNPDSSVFLLEKYLENPQIQKKNLAQAKISLAKAYIANNEMWQSELLFAQVEKDYSEESLGQIAKYNRAELSFFRGDYDWSLMQLDVLKDATTQLISNDAMELALCITDNVASDSNYMPLQLYSKALLFFRQHRFDSALYYAEKVKSNYPGHSLTDEVLMLKAKIFEQQELFDKAADTYETISIAFAHDILVDNALFALANLYQYKLNNSEKAQISYKKIIENHSNSIFIVDARREFRKLRGF
jgi:tetratricopeptide (TPR) repeat protein